MPPARAPAVAAAPAQQVPPFLMVLYARTKLGRTTRVAMDFVNAIAIGNRADIEARCRAGCGYAPRYIVDNILTIQQLIPYLEWLKGQPWRAQFDAVWINDFSLMAEASMYEWGKTVPKGRDGSPDTRSIYRELDGTLAAVGNLLTGDLQMRGILSCHEREAGANERGKVVGGPEVPSMKQTKTLPAWAHVCVRMRKDLAYADPHWPVTFQCDSLDEDWITADRFEMIETGAPANFREMLRASVFAVNLPRAPGLEWQDDVAEKLAVAIAAGKPAREACAEAWAAVSCTDAQQAAAFRHALEDGVARAEYRRRAAMSPWERVLARGTPAGGGSAPPPPPPPTASSPSGT